MTSVLFKQVLIASHFFLCYKLRMNEMDSTSPPVVISTKSLVSLILGLLSLTCCGFLGGIPALILGRSELGLISENKIHPCNRVLANIGWITGLIGTILSAIWTLLYIIMVAIGLSFSSSL